MQYCHKQIQTAPPIICFRPTNSIKTKMALLFSWSTITTKLDIYIYKSKDDHICKGILQAIYLSQ